jgi:hypothetical protein
MWQILEQKIEYVFVWTKPFPPAWGTRSMILLEEKHETH